LDENISLVDIARAIEQIDDPTPLFLDTMHTTAEGAQRIAELLLHDLDRQGLLDPATARTAREQSDSVKAIVSRQEARTK